MDKYVRKGRSALAAVELRTAAAVGPSESPTRRRKTAPLSPSPVQPRGSRTSFPASEVVVSDEMGNEGFQRSTSNFESGKGSGESAPFSEARRKACDPESTSTSLPPPAEAARNAMDAEIEKFFQAAEREQALRFADKYNYDVVGDVPLDGRFEWVGFEWVGIDL